MKVAIIPARGGSKRIIGKNVRDFCGKPIIAYSIVAAKEAQCFDHIIVSTEDPKIEEVAKSWGVEVPFRRPDELADDHVGTVGIMQHAVDWIQRNVAPVKYACCIYATAPFVQPEDIRRGEELIESEQAAYAFSVTSFPFPIQRAVWVTKDNRLQMFYPEHFNTRSQDLEEAYHDAGQFYWGRADAWLSGKPVFSSESVPIVLPRYRVQDIDTEEDWRRAELLYEVIMRDDRVNGV